MLELLEKTNCKPNAYAYSAIIDGLQAGGMLDDALHLLYKLINKGISPTVVTYSSMFRGLCDVGRWKDVKDLLKEMVKEAECVLEIMMQRNVCPDIAMCDALIHGYSLLGYMEKAKEVFDSIADRGLRPSIFSYSGLINGYCKNGNVDEARRLFLEVPSKGLEHSTVTYNIMLHGLSREGRFIDSWKLFEDVEARQVNPNLRTYNILLDGLCVTQHTEHTAEAFSPLCMMKDKGIYLNIVTYGILIDRCCKDGKLDVAKDLLNQLTSKGLQPNVRIYTSIIGSLFEEGSVEEVEGLLIKMEKSGC